MCSIKHLTLKKKKNKDLFSYQKLVFNNIFTLGCKDSETVEQHVSIRRDESEY